MLIAVTCACMPRVKQCDLITVNCLLCFQMGRSLVWKFPSHSPRMLTDTGPVVRNGNVLVNRVELWVRLMRSTNKRQLRSARFLSNKKPAHNIVVLFYFIFTWLYLHGCSVRCAIVRLLWQMADLSRLFMSPGLKSGVDILRKPPRVYIFQHWGTENNRFWLVMDVFITTSFCEGFLATDTFWLALS